MSTLVSLFVGSFASFNVLFLVYSHSYFTDNSMINEAFLYLIGKLIQCDVDPLSSFPQKPTR